jgi:phosphoribosyl-AMP cyclohydrolase
MADSPRSSAVSSALEEGMALQLDFEKLAKLGTRGQRVVPVVLQHAETGEVLFVGYANREALGETLRRRQAVLWSTSRDELWHKGATSGDVLDLTEVRINCEQNSLLYRVVPRTGGACHTVDASGRSRRSCYYRRVTSEDALEPA